MSYYKRKKYNIVQFNNKKRFGVYAINTKTRKILFLIFIMLIAMLICDSKKSFGADTCRYQETVTRTINGVTIERKIVWEYELINGNAENVRICAVIDDDTAIIPSAITENHEFDIPHNAIGTLIIPETLDGHTVVSIGNGQDRIVNPEPNGIDFIMYEYSITELVIPSTVTCINDYAFNNCVRIQRVDFGTSIQRIGNYAFRNTVHLYTDTSQLTLTIPNTVTEIGIGAFEMNADSHYSIDDEELLAHARALSGWKFWGIEAYTGFRKISFGENVTTIGDFAFAGNKRISEITIPSNIITIGKGAFGDCSNVESITFEDRTQTLQVQEFAFSGLDNKLKTITIPNNVNLGKATFKGNSSLNTVIIEDGVSSIPKLAFSCCSLLENITVPNTVTSIEERAFENCDNLKGDITIKDTVNNLGDGVFYDCDGLTSVTINANITKLPNELFYSCDNLEDVTKNSNIVTIGDSCFENCRSINLDVLHKKILTNIATIGISAFENCTGLSGELIIPTNIQNIGDRAFYNCYNVTNIVFNEGIKSIGNEALWGVSKIPEIINLPSSLTNISTRAFYQIREAFINNTEASMELQNRWYGRRSVIVHFSDCKHTIDVTCNLPGVKIVNTTTGEELTSGDYDCESSVTFKVIVEDGYTYPELCVKLVSEGQYADSELVKEFVELNENNEYTINNLTRAKKIIVQKTQNDTDLVLRQFITKINNKPISETRIPAIPAISTMGTASTIKSIQYNHTKYPASVEKDDTITYGIRVYNEGDANGKVKQIKVYLENGLELVQNNETNQFYQWNIQETLEQGTVLTSNYLDGKEIELYTGYGKPEYQELELVCKVTKEEAKRLVSVAELSDSTDADTVGGNFDINMLQDYKKDESYTATSDSYIKSEEDDTDFESVELKQVVRVGYAIVLQKTDSTNLELLNGAKFNLYDKDKNLIESRVTVNDGKLEFSELITFGEGTDTYYIEEVETPAGYKRTINGMIELTVEKTIDENGNVSLKIYCDVNENILDISDDEKITHIDDSDFEIEGFSDKGFDVQFDGYETEENYIPIYTAEQLKKIGATTPENVTIEGKEYLFKPGCYYKLMNDIVLEEAWEPFDFEGTLDGNNFTIKNMRIDNDCSFINEGVSSKSNLGFFGDAQGAIKNLNFENATINVQKSTVGGNIGIISGSMRGTIDNCHVKSSTITANNVENVGGLVGRAYDKLNIQNSELDCSIVGQSNVGGLVGVNQANLYITGNSITEANICANTNAGGIIGNNYANVIITNNTITINYVRANYVMAGGIIGITNSGILNIYKNNVSGTITTGQSKCGGIIGLASGNVDINECNIECSIAAQESDAGGIVGFLAGKLRIQNVKTNNKIHVSQCNAGGFIGQITGGEILIKNCENNGTVTGEQYNIGGYIGISSSYSVVEIINCKNTAAIISNEQSNVGGFIGHSQGTARILSASNSGHIQAKVSNAGGLVGISEAPIIISNSENSGEVIGLNNIGGLIGSTTSECKIYNNSKNTGNISTTTSESADGSNIGGFIGNALGVTRIEDCANEGNVVAYDNAGGLVGYAQSSLDILGCTNKGNIESKRYISGGLVGVAEPSGYTPNNIIVAYDEVDKTINIAIKNKEVVNNYNLVLEKIDISNNVYIDGALFNIYDKDMNLLKENVEVVNGKIEVLNTTINSLNTDVFYIKEVQAPEGYDIQVHDYVRVEVNKTWNSDKEKYEININPTIETEKVDGEYKEDTTKTGTKSDLTQSEYVVWKTSKVKIANSINEGTVTSGTNRTEKNSYGYTFKIQGISGGIAGLIMGNVDIQECTNIGTVNIVYGHMGGIVGFLAGFEEDMTSKIFLCSNGDENNPEASNLISSEASIDSVGGIVGTSVSDTAIIECYNYSNINSDSRIGGIIGWSANNLYIEDCHNLADITSNKEDGDTPVGGLIGSQFGNTGWNGSINMLNKYEYDYFSNSVTLKVINSSFEGTIQSLGKARSQTGGIIGNILCSEEVYVADCKVGGKNLENKTTIKSSSDAVGGIIGTGHSEKLELNNNTISNIVLDSGNTKEMDKAGGLVGEYDCIIANNYWNSYEININNNIIENAILQAYQGSAGGIFGHLETAADCWSGANIIAETNVYINSCNVINSKIVRNHDDGYAGVGGLFGIIVGNIELEIEKCNITDTDIINTGANDGLGGSCCQAGGLIGLAIVSSANIHDSEVKSTKEEKNTIKLLTGDNNTSPIGGLVGAFYGTREIDIQNCKVYNMNLYTENASQFGGVIGGVCFGSNVNIDNVQLEKVALTEKYNILGDVGSKGGFIGGVPHASNVLISNSSLRNSQLNIDGFCVGGIIGNSYSDNNIIKNIALENVEIMENIIKESTMACGGIIGNAGAYYGEESQTQINDSNLTNVDILITKKDGTNIEKVTSFSVGSLVGNCDSRECIIAENKIDNVQIIDNINKSKNIKYESTSIGGVIGTIGNRFNKEYMNLIVNNILDKVTITSRNMNIGGVIGCASSNFTLGDCKVSNTTIDASETEQDNIGYGGIVAIQYAGTSTSPITTITNPIIENVTIKTGNNTKSHAGGIVGIADGNGTIAISGNEENTTVNGLEIVNNSKEGITAGIIAVTYADLNKEEPNALYSNISDIQVNDFTAKGNYAIGGIIGTGITTMKNAIVSNMNTIMDEVSSDEQTTDDNTSEGTTTSTENEQQDNTTETIDNQVVGGIAGIAVEGSDIKNVKVDCEIESGKTYTLNSNNIVGGIVGICSGKLSDSIVENISVKTNKEYIEQSSNEITENSESTNNADTGETTNNNTESDGTTQSNENNGTTESNESDEITEPIIEIEYLITFKRAAAIAVQYYEQFTNCIAKNVTVINGSETEVVTTK